MDEPDDDAEAWSHDRVLCRLILRDGRLVVAPGPSSRVVFGTQEAPLSLEGAAEVMRAMPDAVREQLTKTIDAYEAEMAEEAEERAVAARDAAADGKAARQLKARFAEALGAQPDV
jgi:hypothetical protein